MIDFATATLTLDGTPHGPRDPTALRIGDVLRRAGEVTYVPSRRICASVPGCPDEIAVRKKINGLPRAVRALSKSRPGRGRRLQLPPPPT